MLPVYLTLPDNNDLFFKLRNGEAFLSMLADDVWPSERHITKEELRQLIANLQELLEKCDG